MFLKFIINLVKILFVIYCNLVDTCIVTIINILLCGHIKLYLLWVFTMKYLF